MAAFPGAALMTFLVAWANEHGKLPSEVLAQYKANPRDFQLLISIRTYLAEKEKEEIDRQKKAAEKGSK